MSAAANVRFGSLADITARSRHVRFTPDSGRWAAHPSQHLAVGSLEYAPSSRQLLAPPFARSRTDVLRGAATLAVNDGLRLCAIRPQALTLSFGLGGGEMHED